MKMKRKIMITILSCLMAISLAFPVFAYSATDVAKAYSKLSDEDKDKVSFSGNEMIIGTTKVPIYVNQPNQEDTPTASISMGDKTYFFPLESVDMAYEALVALKEESDSKAHDVSVQRVAEEVRAISSSGVRADLTGAQNTLVGFKDILGTILGVLAYSIMMALTVFTTIDIAYITIPPFRSLCDDIGASSNGSGAMGSTNKSTGENKFRWVTDEAMYSVQNATIESGKSAIVTYLGKRMVAIILVGIAVYLLLTGNIGLILQLSLKMVSGIIDQITALGM